MTPDQARRKVAALLALADPARGGTPAECQAARVKAQQLIARYHLEAPKASRPRAAKPKQREPRFTAPASGPAWGFDWATGKASPNVIVHHYRDRANWRIEIPLR